MRPTPHTFSWLGLCAAMLYAGAVQSNGAAYLLAFLTVVLGAVSWLHARANLRGLELRCGVIRRGPEGEILPMELVARDGLSHHGIELMLAGAAGGQWLQTLSRGAGVQLELRLPAETGAPLRLFLRSAHPLGLFQARRELQVLLQQPRTPAAAGRLPLPDPEPGTGVATEAGAAAAGAEGEDFAGVREWRPGDSLRRVDWHALARGRPLLVKTWAGGGAQRHFDWQALPLPEVERPGQLARWIEEAERLRLTWRLSLPGREIPAGSGPAHAERALAALAELQSTGAALQVGRKRFKPPPSAEHVRRVPTAPLILLGGAVLFAALVLLDFVAPVSVLLLAVCLVWRLLIARREPPPARYREHFAAAPRHWLPVVRFWPLMVLVSGLVLVHFTTAGAWGMEAGVAVLLVLLGAKFLESRTPHDFQIIAMIGWFLCLCGLLTDQGIGRTLGMLAIYLAVAVGMIWMRRSSLEGGGALRLGVRLLTQAAVPSLLLFLLFPRMSLDTLARMGTGQLSQTGVPVSLEPGRVSEVAKSNETAFRVRFPEAALPARQQLYWRCVVLWECNGLSWRRGPVFAYTEHRRDRQPGDIRQTVTLEPHGQLWLPALDQPIWAREGGQTPGLYADRTLGTNEPVRSARRFDVVSRPQLEPESLPETRRQAALQLPQRLPDSLRSLAEGWRREAAGPEVIVQAALRYFATEGFQYTLEPGTYLGPTALEDFLLRRRTGFCEHFSAAFATLMRLAGVPSRVVMGYLGGEFSERGGYMIVRQSDAHAWTEVWLEGAGWVRVDPTVSAAPTRGDLDLASYLLGDEAALERFRSSFWGRGLQQFRLFWDHLNFQWYNTVVSFDEEAQFEWLSWLGLTGGLSREVLLGACLGGLVLALLALHLWLRRAVSPPDPWARAWRAFCRRLEQQGLSPRQAGEGPLAYVGRVAPGHPQVLALARRYAEARYGPVPTDLREFRRELRALAPIRASTKPGQNGEMTP
jgi:transglutaminase-like putative cysteine protease/uncharacterized protein (DUF58 family)